LNIPIIKYSPYPKGDKGGYERSKKENFGKTYLSPQISVAA